MKRMAWIGAACALALAGSLGLVGCGGGTPPTLVITAPVGTVKADGASAAQFLVQLTVNGAGVSGGSLTVSSSLHGSSFSQIPDGAEDGDREQSMETTLNAGQATVRLFSTAAGTANVHFTYSNDEMEIVGLSQTLSAQFTAGEVDVNSVAFISATPDRLQLKGSGGDDISEVRFQVLDAAKKPVPGVEVTFTLGNGLGGAALTPTSDVSGVDGFVSTNLSSGTAVGTLMVTAKTRTSPEYSAVSPPITIAGASANYNNFSITCERFAIAGFNYFGLNMSCRADVADRKTQKIANTQVTFMAEAGAIDSMKLTDEEGLALAIYKTQDPLPVDVEPSAAGMPGFLANTSDNGEEPSYACPARASKTCNPRDGLVTVIAITAGEEAFVDANQNGIWDPGESFTDLPEPYVDVNDNGRFDADHPIEKGLYADTNNNGKWDDKNGKWDGNTQIWKEVKFVWTGGASDLHTGFYSKATGKRLSDNDIQVPHRDISDTIQVLIVDENLNLLAADDDAEITCEYNASVGVPDPESFSITDGGKFGRKFMPSGGLWVADTHGPDDDPVVETGTLTCGGEFARAPEDDTPLKASARLRVGIR